MSETKDSIRSMVQSLIKDDVSKAEVDLHPVFTAKMKEIAGINTEVNEPVIETDDETD